MRYKIDEIRIGYVSIFSDEREVTHNEKIIVSPLDLVGIAYKIIDKPGWDCDFWEQKNGHIRVHCIDDDYTDYVIDISRYE